ncbi:MAG: FHA domain-containing protein [Candidatus Eremiobacteraeota bacterium]|nr:FHA domain-containing protein [Candidatus Eremiobacteraeota bacterium]
MAYAAFAAVRSPATAAPAADLGGAPTPIELEVREPGGTRRLHATRAVLIGRAPAAAVRLDDPTVSRLHARVERRPDGVYVEDLGSRNGTLLNGKSLGAASRLEPGDRVRVGSAEIVLVE